VSECLGEYRDKTTPYYLAILVGLSAITGMYWWAADPPNPWIFAVTGAGALASIGIMIYRTRAGHFKN
jgi:hypothetical protein